jgi:hypothetical protein
VILQSPSASPAATSSAINYPTSELGLGAFIINRINER